MLDADTKRRIDNARDVLVGKAPDPKAQVEQITIALIYKFMDDMDAASEDLGGRRSFFTDGFEQYRWASLVRSGLGGHETLRLYKEALERIPENPNVPRLFRDIFAGAFLPYNDPETLRLFLKEIDGFRYDRSDGFGDAYEYLLRALGSQGDAGQFLTPRHVIEFIVGIVDPQKQERVLDPACGTAGFLVAAHAHIRAANRAPDGADLLTPNEREQIANNFAGYDISPDMTRLSRVNMHLHGFAAPNIQEYDTLTSEQFWTQYADVILANPPFMSPKGGIRPHGRFSVQSKRSEVLFVDYIAEHLAPRGRAGVIVPEGIIFQSQTAHTQLRKMLVEKHLAAVISLPAGVFQPYSGVKTSILILDNNLARRADKIAFFKVESDGFDLGAQRRPIERNDLPAVDGELRDYLRRARAGEPLDGFAPAHGLIVEKARIAASGDYNLSAERYREARRASSEFRFVRLGSIADITAGNPAPQGAEYFDDGEFPFVRTSDVGAVHRSANFTGSADKVNRKAIDELRLRLCPPDAILFPKSGASTFLNHRVLLKEEAFVSSHLACVIPDTDEALPEYVYHMLCNVDARELTPDQAYPSLRLKDLADLSIPLPSMEAQMAIVEEIEGYQRVLDGARAVVEGWRPRIAVDPSWPTARLGDVCETLTPPAKIPANLFRDEGRYPVIDQSQNAIAGYTDDESILVDGSDGLVIFGDHTCAVKFVNTPFAQGADGIKIIKPANDQLDARFLYFSMLANPVEPDGYKRHFGKLKESYISVPPMEVQRAIVEELEGERSLVGANRELMERMASRIAGAVGRAWGSGAG